MSYGLSMPHVQSNYAFHFSTAKNFFKLSQMTFNVHTAHFAFMLMDTFTSHGKQYIYISLFLIEMHQSKTDLKL